MRILIRTIRRTGGGGVEHVDASYDGDVVSIGRATDQVVQLQGRGLPLSHSEMRADGRVLVLRSIGDEHFFVNGKRSRSARLDVGDVVEIGAYRITMAAPASGHEFQIELETDEAAASDGTFGASFQQSLDATGLSRRGAAWGLFLVILLGFLALPAVGLLDRDLGIVMRTLPVPDDGVWDPGPLHPSHQFMGEDCNACHVEAFTMTRDEQCVACHTSTTHHVDVAVHAIAELEEQRCASCHKEHNEPSVLARRDQGLCADCHADLKAVTSGAIAVADAGDFELQHPEFRPSMLVGEGEGGDYDWRIERVSLDDPALAEQSNLIFPHDVHMDAQGLDGPFGEVVMECSDCHRPQPGGAYMMPVRMESHCADCHLLTFDDAFPERELPHGEPDLVVRLLEEFYARQVLVGDGPAPGKPVRSARRPGQERTIGLLRSAPGNVEIVEQALVQAQRAAADVFERTSCTICHEIDRTDDPEHASPWQVRPVRLAQVWMPKAWFDHQAHVGEDCARCHAAEGSASAADVNMPAIESCRDCHGGGNATGKLASTCVECHVFHLPDAALMKPHVRGAELRSRLSDLDRMRPERLDALTPVRTK